MKKTWILVMTLVMSIAFYYAPANGAEVSLGPYLQSPSIGAVFVMFETAAEAEAVVMVGKEGETLDEEFNSEAATWHEVEISGLVPGERYCYKVVSEQDETETYCFRALPQIGESIKVIAFGDTRSQYEEHQAVINAIEAENPDLVVNTGDLVSDGSDDSQWRTFFEIEQPRMAKAPLLPVIGNNDEDRNDYTLLRHYFRTPIFTDPEDPETNSEEAFYFIDAGQLRLFIADDEAHSISKNSFQGRLLYSSIEESKQIDGLYHFIVFVHEGPYSAKPGRSGSIPMRLLVEDLYHMGITAIISGHDHHYWHGRDANGLEFIVSGGGGAPLYDIEPDGSFGTQTIVAAKEYNYIVLNIANQRIEGTTKTPDGRVIDSFTWDSRLKNEVADGDTDSNEDEVYDGTEDNTNDTVKETKSTSSGCTGMDSVIGMWMMLVLAIYFKRIRTREEER